MLEWFRPAAKECRERTGVTEGKIRFFLFRPFISFRYSCGFNFVLKKNIYLFLEAIKEFDSGEIHDDASLKCYMYCIFEVLELINDKGELFIMKLADHIESNYDEEIQNIAFQMGRKCLRPPDNESNCEKAFYYHQCWKTRDPVVRSFFISAYFLLCFMFFTQSV